MCFAIHLLLGVNYSGVWRNNGQFLGLDKFLYDLQILLCWIIFYCFQNFYLSSAIDTIDTWYKNSKCKAIRFESFEIASTSFLWFQNEINKLLFQSFSFIMAWNHHFGNFRFIHYIGSTCTHIFSKPPVPWVAMQIISSLFFLA